MGRLVDLTGLSFGFVTVIEYEGTNDARQSLWKVQCRCGESKSVRGTDLTGGSIRRCGPDCKYKMPQARMTFTTIGASGTEVHFSKET